MVNSTSGIILTLFRILSYVLHSEQRLQILPFYLLTVMGLVSSLRATTESHLKFPKPSLRLSRVLVADVDLVVNIT